MKRKSWSSSCRTLSKVHCWSPDERVFIQTKPICSSSVAFFFLSWQLDVSCGGPATGWWTRRWAGIKRENMSFIFHTFYFTTSHTQTEIWWMPSASREVVYMSKNDLLFDGTTVVLFILQFPHCGTIRHVFYSIICNKNKKNKQNQIKQRSIVTITRFSSSYR